MSQQEFDTYLSLLCRLLRIAPQQRELVADEFRAHMEDRLDELLAGGMEREAAVKVALEEFGDAAGLAAQLVSIAQGRRKRWIMRISAFSIVGMAAAVLLAVALWPEGARVPAPRAVAQTGAGGAAPGGLPGGGAGGEGSVEPTVAEKLATRFDAEYPEIPVKDVLENLKERTGLQIYLNAKAITAAGMSLEAPITINLKRVRLDMLLDLVLEQAGEGKLEYVDRDGILIISTSEALSGASEVKVYNCRDLLAMASPVPGAGAGMMGGWGGMMMGPPGASGGGGIMPGSGGGGVGPSSGGFGAPHPGGSLPALPGAEGAPAAEHKTGEPTSPRNSPPSAGGSPKGAPRARPAAGSPTPGGAPSAVPGAGGPGGTEIPKGISPQIGGGGGGPGMMGGMMGGMAGGMEGGGSMGGMAGAAQPGQPQSEEEIRAERLMHLITTAVKPDSWQDMGGFGTISEYKGLIVINHNARTHKEVENVLKMLREAAGLPLMGEAGMSGGAGMGGMMFPGGGIPGGLPAGPGVPARRQ